MWIDPHRAALRLGLMNCTSHAGIRHPTVACAPSGVRERPAGLERPPPGVAAGRRRGEQGGRASPQPARAPCGSRSPKAGVSRARKAEAARSKGIDSCHARSARAHADRLASASTCVHYRADPSHASPNVCDLSLESRRDCLHRVLSLKQERPNM